MIKSSLFSLTIFPLLLGCLLLLTGSTSTSSAPSDTTTPAFVGIKWMSLNEALEAHRQEKKRIFLDVYTDWCGWCKEMDRNTFADPSVIAYMNAHFYSVKFNAENDDPVVLNGKEYRVVQAGNRTIHTLAYTLLNSRMRYPSYVVLDSELQSEALLIGYMPPASFLEKLKSELEE